MPIPAIAIIGVKHTNKFSDPVKKTNISFIVVQVLLSSLLASQVVVDEVNGSKL